MNTMSLMNLLIDSKVDTVKKKDNMGLKGRFHGYLEANRWTEDSSTPFSIVQEYCRLFSISEIQ